VMAIGQRRQPRHAHGRGVSFTMRPTTMPSASTSKSSSFHSPDGREADAPFEDEVILSTGQPTFDFSPSPWREDVWPCYFCMSSDRMIVDALKVAHSLLWQNLRPATDAAAVLPLRELVHSPSIRSALERGSDWPALPRGRELGCQRDPHASGLAAGFFFAADHWPGTFAIGLEM
jgi:hypothetical protein